MKVIFYLTIALLFVLSSCSHMRQKPESSQKVNNGPKKMISITGDAGGGGGVDLIK